LFNRLARSLVLAAALVAVTASATLAHECYVANRGANGVIGAGTHSRSWFAADLEELAAFISNPADPTAPPPLNEEQLAYFVARAEELGVPATFAIFVGGRPHTGGFTIAENAGFEKNGRDTDGQGIDHFFAAFGDAIFTAYMEALQQ
jgi:opacity protein-like surface antigen